MKPPIKRANPSLLFLGTTILALGVEAGGIHAVNAGQVLAAIQFGLVCMVAFVVLMRDS